MCSSDLGKRNNLTCLGPQHDFEKFGKSGQHICKLFPHIGSVADDIAIIRSMTTDAINHDPAHTLMNTGTTISGRPSMGSWMLYGLGAETENLPGLLSRLAREPETHEVVVVDGGSSDNTIAAARAFGVTVVRAEQGRGIQLAAGAARTKGEILVFLHADSIFPQGGLAAIQKALGEHPDAPGGNFRLLFDGDDDFSRWLEGFYVWIRARGFYYGDSGIFIRRRVLDSLGRILPLALMVDYDLVPRIEKAGRTQAPEYRSDSCRARSESRYRRVSLQYTTHT